MYGQPDHLAVCRRLDHGTQQIVCHSQQLLGVGLHFPADLSYLRLDLLAVFLLTCKFALRQFRDGLLCPHRLTLQIEHSRLQICLGSLQFQQAVARRVAVSHQRPGLAQLLL